jgi:2-polyprenyl-3-methyl-5-hydroxy-6-metoxy-1,4-benzoquinol methylase
MNCRLCQNPATLWRERSDMALHRCGKCGFVSGQPSEDQSPAERYDGYYRREPPPAPEARYHEWLGQMEAAVPRGRLLEVGAGYGGLVRVALARRWRVDATEVSRTGLVSLQQTGASVFAGDVAQAGYPDGAFDGVVSLEVLEHVPSPQAFLDELARVTRPGGALLLTTPNFGGLTRRALGTRWRVITPEHLGYFTPRTLAAALRAAGY